MSTFVNASRIAIIGAGPGGLAAAKYLTAEKAFSKIVIFEQRSYVGGIWKYTPESNNDNTFTVPSTDPNMQLEIPLRRLSTRQGEKIVTAREERNGSILSDPIFPSPIYDRLETNIPRSLMRFSDHCFSDDTQLFPKHATVQDYLERYADPIRHLVQFRKQVSSVRLHQADSLTDHSKDEWKINLTDLDSNEESTQIFDAVIVASGHFITPFIPDIPGIREWESQHPGSITHSKFYRIPDPYSDKKVVVVGNFASGLDVSNQIAPLCKPPLLLCQKGETLLGGSASNSNIKPVSTISSLSPSTRSILFSDGSTESDIDNIVFCTGYLYTAPFLTNETITPPIISPSGQRMQNTYHHLFYAPHPTLALVALPQKVIPFPLAEAQAAVLARVYSGRLGLPSLAKMQEWESAVLAERGEKGFHTLHFPKDAEYINYLYDLAETAERRDGLDSDGRGKIAKRWGEWEFWARERFPEIRRAFVEKGEEKAKVTRLEQIGFDFERFREERMREL
ncbi:FAD/NAD(P)-binding domain-containing protein [Aulographum hederae CBS 113979]|uniref:FAD/NAD(P)-binding domain-containing protein n=1 Tax=Aulographum hederae CBS 113979 TaxID=1176131 RepID=A0A6G1HDS4_9PEZI|nr:FAD/NAD(P)-binding domain-containing protein [Aulographum hederae CBS 113979]